jgi:uncharacterized protein YbjT (DUF2867 family)
VKRVLVAGATGYLGAFVAREFASRGYSVRALARSPRKLKALEDSLDEIVEAEITRPGTLRDVCGGMDVVFSSVGITRQRDGLTFQDVDYQGNRNLLDVALRAGVERFVYVSVLHDPELRSLAIVRAHEDFAADLKASGIGHSVVRPTAYFSDMEEYLAMARRGRVYLIGDGRCRLNPIHGGDLAVTCVEAAEGGPSEIDVGGPEVLTHREIAELALKAAGRPARITSVPVWTAKVAVRVTKLFDRHRGELLAFFTETTTRDAVGPASGRRRLGDHFESLV